MKIIEVKLKDNSYKIYIEKNIFEKIAAYLKENYENKKILIVTDKNLEKLYIKALNKTIQDKNFKTKIISIEPGEKSKSIDTLKKLYEDFTNFNLTRGDLILTFGGGVVGDLGGFAAATYLRGIPYIQIPTSLLAQVDSSVGGKVAVDLPWGKNLVGSFYQPKAVFIDPELLKTLDERFLHDGLAEVIKYGCIRDESIFRTLMNYKDDEELLDNIEKIIYTCCNIKKKVVESDEKDLGERMILNFGHTLGHAVEEYFNYSKYTHGEAVAIGMAEITRRSEELNITKIGTHNFIKKILMKYELPYRRIEMDKEKILHTIKLDKKSSGENINLILLNKIGEGFIKKVSIKEIENYI